MALINGVECSTLAQMRARWQSYGGDVANNDLNSFGSITPENFSSQVRSDGIRFTWDASLVADTYEIVASTSSTGPFVAAGTNITGTSFLDSRRANTRNALYYKIRSYIFTEASPISDAVRVIAPRLFVPDDDDLSDIMQRDPLLSTVGTPNGNSVILLSGISSGTVTYQIRRKDGQGEMITLNTLSPLSELLLQVSASQIEIVLEPRTRYEFRIQTEGVWSGWFGFKTRAKSFAYPDAINQNIVDIANTSRGATVTVENAGKSSIENTSRGATVTNTEKICSDVERITRTSRGETIRMRTRSSITRTSRGVTIDTRN